jgi:hypothetical protein
MERTAFNPYFLRDGFIINEYGENVFTTRRFDDAIEADYWLNFVSEDGQFGTAYIETGDGRRSNSPRPGRNRSDSTVAALRREGAAVTLDNWLVWNGVDLSDAPDAELLEVIPEQFREIYERRFNVEGR